MYIFRKISGKRKKVPKGDGSVVDSVDDGLTSDDSVNQTIGDSPMPKLLADHGSHIVDSNGSICADHAGIQSNNSSKNSNIEQDGSHTTLVNDQQATSSRANHDGKNKEPIQSDISSSQEDLDSLDKLHQMKDFYCERIGSGFFANVYKVKHRATGQVMVLKMSKSPADRKTMQQEIKTMYNLEHPNILRLMGLCVHDGKFHVLTEFINGGTLERLLFDKSGNIRWSVRLSLAHNIASGMAYLHSKGIIHRDLTSKNCLIKREKGRLTAVVADFGLAAKIPNSIHERDKTMSIVGSPYWMAPEVLGGCKYDEKADIFSFGIVLCEILARISADPDELPRTHSFTVDVVAFQPLVDVGCPDEFFQLALHCCQLDPKRRRKFYEIKEVIVDIRAKTAATEALLQPDNNELKATKKLETSSSNQSTEKDSGYSSSQFAALRLKHISADLRLSTIEKFSALTTRVNNIRAARDSCIRETSVGEGKSLDGLEYREESSGLDGYDENTYDQQEVFEDTDQSLSADTDVNTLPANVQFDPFMNSKFSYALSNLRTSNTSSPRITEATKYYSSMPNLNLVSKPIEPAENKSKSTENDSNAKFDSSGIKVEEKSGNIHESLLQVPVINSIGIVTTTDQDEQKSKSPESLKVLDTNNNLTVQNNTFEDLNHGVTRSASHCSPKISPFKLSRGNRF